MSIFEIKRLKQFFAATFLGVILAAGLLVVAQHPASAQLPAFDLSVTKSDSPDPVVAGENLTYTVVAKNNDLLLSATGVTVSDTLPADTTFISASSTAGSCAESGGTVTCDIGNLAASTSATVTIVVRPMATAPATISNTATVTANELEIDTANNSATEETTINHHAPDAGGDAATTDEDSAVTLNVLANDSDLDGDPVTLTNNSGAASGQVSCTNAGSCTYTPNADFNGADSFQYTVSDGRNGTDTATVNITVNAVNDAPAVTLMGEGPVNEGRSITFDFAVSDPDAGDAFTKERVKSGFPDCGTEGTLARDSLTTTATGGSFRCRFLDGPATSTVRMQVKDAQSADSNIATKEVQVSNVAPLISLTGPATADEGQTKTYSYKIIDPGDDTHTTATSCGTKGVKVAGSDTYNSATGDGGFQCRFPDGPATSGVTARVTDSDGASDSDNQLVEVQVSNVVPTLTLSGPNTANEGQTKAYTYTLSDPGDDPNPAITESCGANATRIDTPAAGGFECTFAKGPASSTVSVSANDGDHTGTSSVVVNVSNVAPTISNIANRTIDEGASTGPIPFSIGDAATPANALQVSGSSSNTTLVPNSNIEFGVGSTPADRTVKVTPAPNQSGTATITVSVSDGTATASAPFLLTVRAVDAVAPTLIKVTPSGKRVSPRTKVTAIFSEEMNEATVEASGTFMLKKGATTVPATVVYDEANDRAILTPSRKLKRGATYTATMTTSAKDLAGNALAAGKVWKFRVR